MTGVGFRVAAAVVGCGIAVVIVAGSGCGGGGDGAPAPPQEATTPAVPAGLSATAGDGTVTLTWQPVEGATAYNLYWSSTPGVTKASGTRIASVTSPYVHGPLPNGAAVYYVVTAVGPGGECAESEERSAAPHADAPPPCSPPDPPSAAAVASYSASGVPQFTITWPPVAGATSYHLYWGTEADGLPASGARVANVSSPHVHGGLSKDSPYFYVVTAANGCGEGGGSAAVGGRTPGELAAPASVEVHCTPHVGPSWTFDLSWPAVPFASSYDVSAFLRIDAADTVPVGATATTELSVTVHDCGQYMVHIPGAHDSYTLFSVSASACAPGVACPVASPGQSSTLVNRCLERPTVVGWDRATRTLRWAPAAGARYYLVGARGCTESQAVVEAGSCAPAECTTVIPESCAGAPDAAVLAAACTTFSTGLASDPFPLDW